MTSTTTESDDLLPYSVLRLDLGDEDASMVAVCQGVRIVTNACLKDLQEPRMGDNSIAQQFNALLRAVDSEMEAMENLQDWMILPCTPFLKQTERREHSTLQSYLGTDTTTFDLLALNGRVEAKRRSHNDRDMRYLVPRIAKSEPFVQQAFQQGVPCYPASDVAIVREAGISEWESNAMPTTVQVPDVPNPLYLKSILDKTSFLREVEALLRIRSITSSDGPNTSKLMGLVQWASDTSICGLLVQYIPGSKTLDWFAEHAPENDRTRWCVELRSTVAQLHSHDIIWGDVKLENILIDSQKRLWVIDFGGGFCPDWVDEDLQGTKSGDLQGVSRIEAYLTGTGASSG